MSVHSTTDEDTELDREAPDRSRYPETPMEYFTGRFMGGGMMRSMMVWCIVAMAAALAIAATTGVRVWGFFCIAMMVAMMFMMMGPSHRHHH